MNRKLIAALLFALVLGAAIQNFMVFERAADAGWQWFKFSGYSNDGKITLGKRTAIQFYSLSAVLIVMSVFSVRAWAPISRFEKVFGWAPAALYSFGMFAYTVLAFGPLNEWRP